MFQLSPQILQLLQSQFGQARPSPIPFHGPALGGPKKPVGGSFGGYPGMVPGTFNGLQGLFGNVLAGMGMAGTVSGGTGTRGPAPSSFVGLNKFAGPFGNGGGPIAPSMQMRQYF